MRPCLAPICTPLQVGGATALIGDPTGKRTDRPLLSEAEVAANAASIAASVEKLFSAASAPAPGTAAEGAEDGAPPLPPPPPLLVNNMDFYRDMGVVAFMRDVGRFARLNSMLAKDSVAARMQPQAGDGDAAAAAPVAGLSFTEFSYQLFQAWDFCRLSEDRAAACVLQVGGADQWGNITAGLDLIRRRRQQRQQEHASHEQPQQAPPPVHGLTVPLLTTSDGAKWGKSAGNVPVWLDEGRTSHHALYQFLLATPDADVEALLRRLTLIPDAALAAVLAEHASAPHAKKAQRALADGVTEVVRGSVAVQVARRCAALLFSGSAAWSQPAAAAGAAGTTAPSATQPQQPLNSADLLALAASGDLPSVALPGSELATVPLVELLVRGGLSPSRSEARRTIAAGGLQINGVRVPGTAPASTKAAASKAAGAAAPAASAAPASGAAAPSAPTHLDARGGSGHFIDGAVCLLSLGARKRLVVVLRSGEGAAGAAPLSLALPA